MSLDEGRLRHRVKLQRPVHTQNPTTGEISTTWQTMASVWAAIEPVSVKQFIQSSTTQNKIAVRILIRYRTDIDATWRAWHNGKAYAIEGPPMPDADSGLEYLTLMCGAGVTDGQ